MTARRGNGRVRVLWIAGSAAAWGSAAAVLIAFGAVGVDLLSRGAAGLRPGFLTEPVLDAGRGGGIGPPIVSTALLLAVAIGSALPVSLSCAVYLSEVAPPRARSTRWMRSALDLLAGVPSIALGLFGMVAFADVLGMGFSILAGGLTLACMVMPTWTRVIELGLRAVPAEQRLAAASLGLCRATTLARIVLPAASRAIAAGGTLAIGRVLSETAALLFTAGYVTRMPESLLDSGRALSVHIYDLAMNVPGGERNAYATALVLVALIVVSNAFSSALVRAGSRGAAR